MFMLVVRLTGLFVCKHCRWLFCCRLDSYYSW